jgi:ATP-binding cassette subfamily B protein
LIFVAIGVWLWLEGMITAGTLLLVPLYAVTTFNVVWGISKSIIKVSAAFTEAAEMVDIFEQKQDVQDPHNPEPVAISAGVVQFSQVNFGYGSNQQVFSKLDFRIEAGEKVALVGHSGAGKTTITKLLLRFSDISGGDITIDGQSISKILQTDLRQHIAYVPQEPLLFHRTLEENIAYAKPHATKEEIVEVSKKARAHEFIEKLPKGYETLVGERGIKLSGGERQRVAIARAMLKDAPIIMLDEATSALDSLSEQKIQEALWELMAGKTTIVIAHRLSTIQKMDRIIVFDAGAIIEQGSHAELLAQGGTYAELWHSQVGGFIAD